MLDQVCGGASATLGDRIVFMIKVQPGSGFEASEDAMSSGPLHPNSRTGCTPLATRKRILPYASRWQMGPSWVGAVFEGGMSALRCLMPARAADRCSQPWNKGLLIGQKKLVEPKHVCWVRLEIALLRRDRAIFNLAIDSELRACDLVRLGLGDICSGENVRRRATIVQKKTRRPVQFEITELGTHSMRRARLPIYRKGTCAPCTSCSDIRSWRAPSDISGLR
jgi:hypothetical protein